MGLQGSLPVVEVRPVERSVGSATLSPVASSLSSAVVSSFAEVLVAESLGEVSLGLLEGVHDRRVLSRQSNRA